MFDVAVVMAFAVTVLIIPIAYVDWMLFAKGKKKADRWQYLPATALEMIMLAMGILIGRLI